MAAGGEESGGTRIDWPDLSRRRFLQLSAALAAFGATACQPAPSPTGSPTPSPLGSPTPTPAPITDLPFGVWEALREGLRTSPDHLAAAADRAVASADAEVIFAFVRDQIATYPPRSTGFTGAETDTRWGTRGTLRSGAGTPREKAGLLAELYVRAGFEAEVVTGTLLPERATDKAILYRPLERSFEPAIDDATLDAWAALVADRPAADPDLEVIDVDGAEAGRLAETLAAALPAGLTAEPFDWSTLGAIPLVRVVVGGADRFANPLLPDADFGEHYCEATPRRAAAAMPGRSVGVKLQVARSDRPSERITIAEGTWRPDDLVGRQLAIQLAPAGQLAAVVLTPLDQLHTFVPVLSLRGPDVSAAVAAESAVVGTVVTVGGDLLEETDDGAIAVNGVPLAAGPSDPAAGAAVATLSATIRADAFPTLRLRVTALDASGAPVSGLPTSAFAIEEDGVGLGAIVHANEPPPQRVLLLFDTSDSIPAEFRGAAAVELGRRLATDLVAIHPTVQLRAAAVDAGLASAKGEWTRDPEALADGVAALTGFGSDIWASIVDARKLGPTVIVLITDAQATDRPEIIALNRPKVAAGVPVVGIGVGEVDAATLGSIAALTGGTATTAAQSADAIAAVRTHVEIREAEAYDITLRAPGAGPASRTLRLLVGAAVAEIAYDVPVEEARVAPPGLVGLYLEVSQGSRRALRTLAGIDPIQPLGFREAVPKEVFEEVRGALFGSAILSVEGAAPTASAWLDDMLAARLTMPDLWRAAEGTTIEPILAALEAGALTIPPALFTLHAPLPGATDATSLTFETGLRAVLYVQQPRLGVGFVERADILPLADWQTATDDPANAFRLTMARTARLAVAESALFDISAGALLDGRELAAVAARGSVPTSGPAADWRLLLEAYRDDHRLVPTDEGPFAMWAVGASGRVIGVLPDGSGGGSTAYERTVEAAERLLALLSLLGSLYGAGFAFSAFLALQKAIVNQIVRQAIMVAAIGTEECIDPRFNEVLKNLACDLGKSALPKIYPVLDKLGKLDKISKVAGGPSLKCPKLPVECI